MSILSFVAIKPKSPTWQSMWKLITITLLMSVSSCSTYKSSFTCGNARGVECASMDRVDYMIQNGEIERFNEERQNRKYQASKTDPSIIPSLQKEQNKQINNELTDSGEARDAQR